MNKIKTSVKKNISLKESYEQRKRLAERAQRSNDLLIAENYSRLILEAIDKEELKKATSIIEKLGKIRKEVESDGAFSDLTNAIDTATKEVNEFIGGDRGNLLKRGLGGLAKKFGIKVDSNPLLKSLTLLNCLETGFDQVDSIIKNNIRDYDPSQSLSDQVDDEKAKKTLEKSILNAFQPAGTFAKIKSLFSGGGIPYLKQKEYLVLGIMEINGQNLKRIISIVREGNSTEDIEKTVQALTAKQTASGGTSSQQQVQKLSTPKVVTSVPALAQAVAAYQVAQGTPGAEQSQQMAQDDPKKLAIKLIASVAKKSGKDEALVKKVVLALIKAKKMKTNITLKVEESRTRNLGVLSLRDIADARELFIESGASSRRWIKLLTEASFGEEVKSLKIGSSTTPESVAEKLKELLAKQESPEKKNQLLNAVASQFNKKAPGASKTDEAHNEFFKKLSELTGTPIPEKKNETSGKPLSKEIPGIVDFVVGKGEVIGKDSSKILDVLKSADPALLTKFTDLDSEKKKEFIQAVNDKLNLGMKSEDAENLFKKIDVIAPKLEDSPAPVKDPEAEAAAKEIEKGAANLEDKKGVDKKNLKKSLENLTGKLEKQKETLNFALSSNKGNNIGDSDLAAVAQEELDDAITKVKELLKKDDPTPAEVAKAFSDSSSAILGVGEYIGLADQESRKSKEEKSIKVNEKALDDLRKNLENTKQELEKLTGEKKASGEAAQEKYGRLAGELAKSLEGLDPSDIVSILDAIPDFLLEEGRRQRRILEARLRAKLS